MKRANWRFAIEFSVLYALVPIAAYAAGFAPAGSLSTQRYGHTATLLPNGKVLVAGGYNGGNLGGAELFDPAAPAASAWSSAGTMATARCYHTATLLPNGKVLITGGYGGISSAEIYDPMASEWSSAGNMNSAREEHTATLLLTGKVLVTGGLGGGSTSELYDPSAPPASAWSFAGNMSTARLEHEAILLINGKVLVTGGTGSGANTAELYDPNAPAASAWSSAGTMSSARYYHRAVRLVSGKVLVMGGAGGISTAEVYDPAAPVASAWSTAGSMSTGRFLHTATTLQSGNVLVTGGQFTSGSYLNSAEIYDPSAPVGIAWTSAGTMAVARDHNAATLLQDGRVLIVAGGTTGGTALKSAEVYDLNLQDLIAWYKFDEGSGPVANDSSGYGNTGALVNAPAWTSGIKGGGLSFDGIDDQVLLPDNLIAPNVNITIALWFKSTKPGVFVGQNTPNPQQGYIPNFYIGNDGKLRGAYWCGTTNPLASSNPVNDGLWHHAALTGAVNTQSLYLDGVLQGTLNGTIDQQLATKNQLGSGLINAWASSPGGYSYFTGQLDDVRIYNRPLSVGEVQVLAYQPPTANGDLFGTAIDKQVSIASPGVLANDRVAVGGTLSAVLDATVSHGNLTLNSNGSFSYSPMQGFIGTDSFTYHANDGTSNSLPGTVTIQVLDFAVTTITPPSAASGQLLTMSI